MQDFLLYSAIPGPGRSRPVPACPADSHCVIVYPPAIQIATLDLLNFIKNESWVPCKMQNGGMGAAGFISSLGRDFAAISPKPSPWGEGGTASNPCRARRLGAPSYRLGGLFRRRKGAGDSVERLPLVFRCRLFGGGRELGTPLFDSVFAAAGSSAAQGNGGYGESPRFFRRARCPHRAVPGRPGVPLLRLYGGLV